MGLNVCLLFTNKTLKIYDECKEGMTFILILELNPMLLKKH